jgi:hypothetical protein
MPAGKDIPLGARILAIADAFSAMVSPRPFPATLTYDEAFEELRRCAGRQFDPELVERFIGAVLARDDTRTTQKPVISDAVMLEIGQEAERIAVTLDHSDYSQLSTLARRLAAVAAEHGLQQVAELASQIVEAAHADGDLLTIAKKLVQACRLPSPVSPRRSSSTRACQAATGPVEEVAGSNTSRNNGTGTDVGA